MKLLILQILASLLFFSFCIEISIQDNRFCWNIKKADNLRVYCFDVKPKYLEQPFFESLEEEKILPGLYEYFLQLNEGAQKFDVTFDQEKRQFGLLMNKREMVKKEETILKLNINKTLNSDSFDSLSGVAKPDLEGHSTEAKLTLYILHQLYNIESSPFKEFLKAFRFSEDLPIFLKLSAKALGFLEGDPAYNDIFEKRDRMMTDYDKVLDALKQWTPEQKSFLLGSTDFIDASDWVNVYSLVLRKAWKLGNSLYIVPGANFAGFQLRIKSDAEYHQMSGVFSETHIRTYDNSIYFLALDEIKFNAPITDFYGKRSYLNSLFVYNQQDVNPSECFEIEILSEEGYQALGDQAQMVLKAGGVFAPKVCIAGWDTSMKSLEVVKKVLRMYANEAKDCYETLITSPVPDPKARMSVILKDCASTKENGFDGDKLYEQVEEKVRRMERNLDEIENLENFAFEGEILRFYIGERKKLAEKILEYMRKKLGAKRVAKKTDL